MKEDPRHIRISEFNYPLPDERIAKFPLSVRDQSKLLLYRHGEVSEDRSLHVPVVSAIGKPDDIQQYQSHPSTPAFPERDGSTD